jgi:hypothetical protein
MFAMGPTIVCYPLIWQGKGIVVNDILVKENGLIKTAICDSFMVWTDI